MSALFFKDTDKCKTCGSTNVTIVYQKVGNYLESVVVCREKLCGKQYVKQC